MKNTYFHVRLYNAIYEWQRQTNNSTSAVYKFKPEAVEDCGVILGISEACENYHIEIGESLNTALLKCANLLVGKADFELIRRKSAMLFNMLSRFGVVYKKAYNEAVIQMDELSHDERNYFTVEIQEAIKSELGIDSEVRAYDCFSESLNIYSYSVPYDNTALEVLAGNIAARLKIDNCAARLFSLSIKDASDMEQMVDKRLAMPFDEPDMILLVLKSVLDLTNLPIELTLTAGDIVMKKPEVLPEQKDAKGTYKKLRKKTRWDYVKENREIKNTINENGLYKFTALTEFLVSNPFSYDFDELCAVAEKANTRRIQRGNCYINFAYAELFADNIEINENANVLINGYCPFRLLYLLNDLFKFNIYYENIDERTLNIIEILNRYTPNRPLNLKPAVNEKFDFILTNEVKMKRSADQIFCLCEKSFFSSKEREKIAKKAITDIYDFGENGFIGTTKQYCILLVNSNEHPKETIIHNLESEYTLTQEQEYITDSNLPCWVIYRNEFFDKIYSGMQFGIFDVLYHEIKARDIQSGGDACIISSECIKKNGTVILPEKRQYVNTAAFVNYPLYEYVDRDDVFLASKTSTTLKVGRKPKGCIPNRSSVILIPKKEVSITPYDIQYYYTEDFRRFYDIALNRQNFMLSTDFVSLYFLGKRVS